MSSISRQSAAYLRYRVLDKLFRDTKHKYNIKDLVRECNARIKNSTRIQESSIRHDISFMKKDPEWKMKIKGYGRPVEYYRYEDVNQRCKPLEEFSEDEQNLFANAVQTLSCFSTPHYQWARLFLTMLEKTGGNVERNSCVEFQNNNELKGLEWFSSLLESCLNHEPLTIVYKPYHSEELTFYVSPYWLKQYNNRWFLICKDDRYDTNTHLALDRIVSVEANPTIRFRRMKESQDAYFRHVIGVTKHPNGQKKAVVLRVQPERIKYIETKPFTDMQTIKQNEDGTYDVGFRIEMNTEEPEKNKELIQTIMSFGSDVEVISPVEIRNEVKRNIQILMERYFDPKNVKLENGGMMSNVKEETHEHIR